MARDSWTGCSTFILWSSVFISTAVLCASVGYIFGQRALSGVSSPVTTTVEKKATVYKDPRTIPLVDEKAKITKAKEILKAPSTPTPATTPTSTPSPKPTSTPSPTPTPDPTATNIAINTPAATLLSTPTPPPTPISTPTPTLTPTPTPTPTPIPPKLPPNPGAITMQVLSVQEQGNELVLNLALQNNTQDSVRFLYTFLQVTDEKGRPLRTSTQGLPGDLPPNGNVFQGTVRIPVDSLRGARSLSLNLSDYPTKRHQLVINGIPVPR